MYLDNQTTVYEDVQSVMNVSTTTSTVDPTVIFGAQRDTLFVVVPITIVYTLIFITGLVGNVFTCIVIIINKSMHTATNYYLFSLAISDLLLLVSGMPQEMYSIWYKWPYVFGETFCLFRGLAAETSTNASILTISLFTIERYLAICHPFQSHKMSKLSRATKHVVALWVFAFAFALPLALQFGLRYHKGVAMCLQTREIIPHSFEVSTFLFFCAPMVLISVLYFLIGLKLNETSRGRVPSTFQQCSAVRTVKPRRHSQSTKRVIKMLVAVVVAFFICWAPFHAQRLVAIYGTTENHHARSQALLVLYGILTYTSGVLYYMSTCINPILYHIMCNKFRVAFKNTVVLCQFGEEQAAVRQLPGSTLALVRLPTSSGSDHSSNIIYRKETTFSKKTSLNDSLHEYDENAGQYSKWNSPEPSKPDCGGGRFCNHKLKTLIREEEATRLDVRYNHQRYAEEERNYTKGDLSSNTSRSRNFQDCFSKRDNKSTSLIQITDNPNYYEQDELTTYLKEINERIRQCEMDYLNVA